MFITEVDPSSLEALQQPVTVIGLGLVTEKWELPFHSHDKAQLIFAETGLIILETEGGLWVVPPQGAVWIPGGVVHRSKSCGNTRGFAAFINPDVLTQMPSTCCTIAVSPFLRALLERMAALDNGYEENTPAARLMDVLLDELIAAPLEWLNLPMPTDSRLRKLADAMLATPAEHSTLSQWANRIGMSERNMSRLFVEETGLSVSRWRRQMHVVTALPLLAQGQSIQSISEDLGYESSGAFVTMFRKAVGMPPKRFLAERMASIQAPLSIPSRGFYEYQ